MGIFAAYATLGAGEAFVVVIDHDPTPLSGQFAAEHAGDFTWDYLEEVHRCGGCGSGALGPARSSLPADRGNGSR